MNDSSASYTTYDEEENPKCLRDGKNAIREPNPGTPEGNRLQRFKAALEDAAKTRQGYVYFLESADGQYIKIGFSNNPRRRLWEQKLAARLIGVVPGSQLIEQWLHQRFATDLAHRREWFHKSDRLEACISALSENPEIIEVEREPNMRGHQIQEDKGQIPLHMMLSVSLSRRIDDFRFKNHITTRTRAVRILLEMALKANGIEVDHE